MTAGREMRREASGWAKGALAGLAALALAGLAGPATAQESPRACRSPAEAFHAPCVEVALGVHAARAAIGLAAAGGAGLPGTNSTLGKRVGSTPRVALAFRGGLVRAPVALLGEVPAEADRAWFGSFRGDLAVGLFDGFSAAPTVGGILSVDALGSVGLVTIPDDAGLRGGTVKGAGLGLRVGLVRESFTLPGVTVSATRRWIGETTLGRYGEAGSGARLDGTTLTSVRGVAGKDFFALGVLAGAGWDRYGGDARIQARTAGGAIQSTAADDLTADRVLFFGGVSWNFLVLQLAAEGGWARGLDAPTGRGDGGFDPEDGSAFGSVSLRLVF